MAEWSSDCFYSGSGGITVPNAEGVATIQCLEPLFKNIVGAIVGLAGIALFVMLMLGGFNFLMSGGDPKKLEQARHTITFAIVGLVIIVCGYLILFTIQALTGIGVTQFSVPSGR